MAPSRIVLILVAAVLPVSGCGRGCGSERAAEPVPDVRPADTNAVTTTTTTTRTSTTLAAAGPGPYQLERPTVWKVGDVVSSTASARTTGRIKPRSPDGRESPALEFTDTIQAAWTEQVTEVDSDGRRARFIVHLNQWSRKRGRERDASIEGASLDVSGTGAARNWSFVAHKDEPSPEAKNWLDEHFGGRGLSDEQWLRIMLPENRLPVAGTFSPDPEALATAFSESGFVIDRSKISASVALEAVEGTMARCKFEIVLPLLRVPNTEVAWTSGGSLNLEGTMSVPLEPAPLILAELDRTGTMKGEAVQDDSPVEFDFVIHERRTTSWGGTLPDGTTGR